ncbi:MAG: DNA-3-methyladenine glycosylase [Clostridia bacterium]|nr:DNA-3-methyladenine glycosylase [Clostridia bacterium]MDD4375905.1 DNA-3-methyladenine glycosylase [Clostridia bacterium]
MNKKLTSAFYKRSALVVAPELLGKVLVRNFPDGTTLRYSITETEAYYGEKDTACHARAGRTKRTAPLYEEGGIVYIYLCYGIHNLLNVVTGKKEEPQAVLIRGIENYDGPGKLTKALDITRDLNTVSLINSDTLWIEDIGITPEYFTTPRIGIDYASEPYKSIEWRYVAK